MVKINSNPLKMLSSKFLHISRKREHVYTPGGKYKCEHPVYGCMGEVECMATFSLHLYELKPTMMLLAEGHIHLIQEYKDKGFMNTERMQCSTFQFIRRYNASFTYCIDKELPKIGVHVVHQPELFIH